ncbi:MULTISPECIES: hypothetical protein [Clostridium]|uniref:hypothetical protein n=1 Tax=Clostridium TaxID=1485 RepID=UPI000826058C|nr:MULTISPECIES: hypothetical protein [Clostridium]PJI08585.1 hypothetical protein CUB90_12265 [Clostridium sp. CT7]
MFIFKELYEKMLTKLELVRNIKHRFGHNYRNPIITFGLAVTLVLFLGLTYFYNTFCKMKTSQEVRTTKTGIKSENSSIIINGAPTKKSKHGNPQESVQPSLLTVQWNEHGIYMLDGGENSSSLKKKLGKYIGKYIYDGYNYELYTVKGLKTHKYIIVKSNHMYSKYNFAFKDTIIFNGHTYIISDEKSDYKKGKKIGMSGPNDVYEMQGEDSEKVIDVVLQCSSNNASFKGDFTAYREY